MKVKSPLCGEQKMHERGGHQGVSDGGVVIPYLIGCSHLPHGGDSWCK